MKFPSHRTRVRERGAAVADASHHGGCIQTNARGLAPQQIPADTSVVMFYVSAIAWPNGGKWKANKAGDREAGESSAKTFDSFECAIYGIVPFVSVATAVIGCGVANPGGCCYGNCAAQRLK
jgi:hypothetical protein